ncbi:MAG: glycosyl hydrolase-related protein [Spirochaetaceae bacterium]|jgi:alpha-mannosidase|nr:glycosyl hydrolase-related protein [Spirochaetaceae bacterium]
MLIPKVEPRINQYLDYLEKRSYRKLKDLAFEVFQTGETLRLPPEQADWKPIQTPAPWGKEWTCFWFKAEYTAPEDATGPVFLSVLPNADSLAFIDGKPYGAFNRFHQKVRIAPDGKTHTLHVEAYSGHFHGGCGPFEGTSIVVNIGKTLPDFPNTFDGGCLLERLSEVHGLLYDVKALYETSKMLDQHSLRKARILKGVHSALMGVSFNASDDELSAQAAKARASIAPLLSAKNSETTPQVHLIGHAHIDHAWLWHIGETERKTARTFINMTRFIEEYPEFIFIQSQPCQLEIVKNEYPDVFEAIKNAYAKGSWEPNGGMWVEADCNVTGGESLIRQFLVGKAVNKALLGYSADTLWLPDVFGYSAALPQILAGCGIRYFVTSKINWNDTTRFPYETFIWRGLDGTGLKTHFLSTLGPGSGYNGRVNPEELTWIWNSVQHKEVQSACVKSIGEGDGGGGTLRADLEMARRLIDLEGCPKSGWKKTSDALAEIFADPNDLPEWRGELYLELHRGTYTTQARTKRNNRKLEFALRNTEFLCSLGHLDGEPYPKDLLLASWKRTLTNQFHDIIPGSSIRRVYAEAEADSARTFAGLADITEAIQRKLLGPAGGVLAVNDLSWERRDGIRFAGDASALRGPDGAVYPVQRYTDLDGIQTGFCVPKLPPLGWASFAPAEAAHASASPFLFSSGFSKNSSKKDFFKEDFFKEKEKKSAKEKENIAEEDFSKEKEEKNSKEEILQTPFYRIRFDAAGRIVSLVDLRQDCELVAEGGAFNGFITAEDVPVFWDAWDIDADWTRHITEETRLLAEEVAADGPLCFRLRRKYAIGKASTLTQDMVCYAHSPRIDFETRVSWREKWRLLKAVFDTAITTNQARCEVQYGHLLRNTHKNLLQDRARFEICAHKWISLEETGRGIALLNDCKYGHDAEGGRVRLSLLRSPIAPDPEADQGEHRFTYALLPFAGDFSGSGAIQSAYELNAPVYGTSAPGPGSPAEASLCAIEGPGIIAECVKAPENLAEKTAVFRLYESLGGRSRGTLRFSRELKSANQTDMLEEQPQPLPVNGKELNLTFRPFEIKTIAVAFRR